MGMVAADDPPFAPPGHPLHGHAEGCHHPSRDSPGLLSPFSAALGDGSVLPPVFREQFLLSPEQPHALQFEGRMDRVWRRHRWLRPIFWLLAWSEMLFPETGEDVPATMTIVAGRDDRGLPQQRWNRTFVFARTRHFDAVVGFDPERGQIVERFGRTGRLEVAWRVRFLSPDTIEIATRGAALRVGRFRVPLPRHLFIAVYALEQADRERDDTITINLRLTFPLLGPIFGYAGTFRLRRIAPPSRA